MPSLENLAVTLSYDLLTSQCNYYYYYYRNRVRSTHMNTHEKKEIKKT